MVTLEGESSRTGAAYGMSNVRILALPTAVFITVHDGVKEQVTLAEGPTQTLRLDQIADVYALGEAAQRAAVTPREGLDQLTTILRKTARFGRVGAVVGHTILTVGVAMVLTPALEDLGAAAVLGTATLLAATASLALPQLGPGAAGWLLPSLGLTASGLALATTVAPLRAICITAGTWILAVVVTVMPPAPSSVLFALAGQVAFAALALLAAAVLLVRRGHFESDRGFDTTPRFAARRLR